MNEILNKLKEEFLNQEITIGKLDSQMRNILEDLAESNEYKVNSIFDYSVHDMITDSFCWQYAENTGFNFEFELIEDKEYRDQEHEIVVKVISVDTV